MSEPLIILRRTMPHQLSEGWIECPECGRQLALTRAGLIRGHYKRGESHHMGVPMCPTRGVKP